MQMEEKFSLELSQEEGILLLTSARLLDKLVAGVTIHAKERDELIRDIIDKLSLAVSPALATMSDELADAIVDSVLGTDEEQDDEFFCPHDISDRDFVEASTDGGGSAFNYPMYSIDTSLPLLEQALITHVAVSVEYYSLARESIDALTLDPLSIMREEGMWRMVAYCHELDDVMLFRIDRMKNVVETTKHFETPKNFSLRKHEPFAAYC
ncbi:MAG: WYL domain-containing protein [Cyanobacteria bacterium SZAS-4]|nr:WYL domain-containing protein [Cyanobacteria bacterium SZAS-4]